MNADSPNNKTIVNRPESKPSDVEKETVKASKNGNSARGLADFVESFLSGSRLRRAGVPTRAKVAEPVQEESPELLDLVLEGPDALVIVERESGLIVEGNHRFAEWTGTERSALNNRRFLDFFPEPEHKAARTLYEDAGAGGVHVIELPGLQRGSRPRLIEFTATPTKTAHGAFAVIVGRDVGERAATERYLRAERDRLNLFLRSMRDTLVLLSPAGDILFANPAAEQIFEPYELPVICHRWLNEFARNDHADLQGLASAYEGQSLEIPCGDGRIFLVTRSFLFESGRKAMIMLMAKDVTEQRLIEKQNHQLEIELIRESKLAEFGTLSAGIAHNLNGPLTGILGFCDLMEIRSPGQMEVQQIRQQAVVMKEIVSNMLHKSRSERESQPKELVIEDVIRTELRFLEANLFFKHQVKKVVDLDANVPPVYGIYIDFSQVIGNLLRNAIDAMYNSTERVLSVRTRTDGGYLLMMISDTGSGMSEETRNSLFQPFFTTKPKAQDAKPGEPTGTGLGLSTSRSILARYGAEITVDSELGKGSTFTIRFPLHRRPAQ
jgi:PAS domain S-box-containing protein